MATKTVQNYSVEQVKTMRETYSEATTQETREAVVMKLAAKFGKPKRSIISKMSREGFYIPKKVVSAVTGETPAKKDALAVQVRVASSLPMVSAEKLNKTDLQDLITHFAMFNKLVTQLGAETIAETIADFDAVEAEDTTEES